MAFAQSGVAGIDCISYYNVATDATPTWVAMPGISDLTVNQSKDRGEASSRRSQYKMKVPGQKEISADFTYIHQLDDGTNNDAVFDALIDSYDNNTVMQFAFMDGSITDAVNDRQGRKMMGIVFDINQSQELNGAVSYDVTIENVWAIEAAAIVDPSWFEEVA